MLRNVYIFLDVFDCFFFQLMLSLIKVGFIWLFLLIFINADLHKQIYQSDTAVFRGNTGAWHYARERNERRSCPAK